MDPLWPWSWFDISFAPPLPPLLPDNAMSKGVNYSKWDHIDTESDDDEPRQQSKSAASKRSSDSKTTSSRPPPPPPLSPSRTVAPTITIFLIDQSVDQSRLPSSTSSLSSPAVSDAIIYLKPPAGFHRWLSKTTSAAAATTGGASSSSSSSSLLSAALDTTDPSVACSAVDLSFQARYDEHVPTLLSLLVKTLLPDAIKSLNADYHPGLASATAATYNYLPVSIGALGKEACAVALSLLSISSRITVSSSDDQSQDPSLLLKLCAVSLSSSSPSLTPVALSALLLVPSASSNNLDYPHDGGSYLPLSNPLSTSVDCGGRAVFQPSPLCSVVYLSPSLPSTRSSSSSSSSSSTRPCVSPFLASHQSVTRLLSRHVVPRLGMSFTSLVHASLSESVADLLEAAALYAKEGFNAPGGEKAPQEMDEDGDITFNYKGGVAYYFPPYFGPAEESESDNDEDNDEDESADDGDEDDEESERKTAAKASAPSANVPPPSRASIPAPPGVSIADPERDIPYTLSVLPSGLNRCTFHLPARLLPLLMTSAVSCNGCFFELHANLNSPPSSLPPPSVSGKEEEDDDDDDHVATEEPLADLYTDFVSPNPHFTARAIEKRLKSRVADPNGGKAAEGCRVS